MLDISVADEPARAGDDLLGKSGDLCDTGIEIARGIALRSRAGERREIVREREALGFRLRLLAESAFALELGRRQGGQLQGGAQRGTIAAEGQAALDDRRHHDDPRHHDALLVLQQLRQFGGTIAAIAFAQEVFGRRAAAILGKIEGDDFGHGLRILAHAVESIAAVGFGRPAPAGANRIDHDQIGKCEPGGGIVAQARGGSVVAGKLEDARTGESQIEVGRRRPRPAVEGERDGAARRVGVLGDIGGVIDCGRTLARLIEQRERSRGRTVKQRAAWDRDSMLGDGVRRQEPQHALAGLLPLPRVARVLFALLGGGPAGALLRDRERGCAGD